MVQNASKSAMHNGLIIGSVFSLSFILGTMNSLILSLLSLLLLGYSIFLLYKLTLKYRESLLTNSMGYWHAFIYVYSVFLFSGVISAIVKLIYVFMFPKYLPMVLNETLKIYDRLDPRILEENYDLIVMIFKPHIFPLANLMSQMFIGVFLCLILAIFLKKEKSIFED